MHEIIHATHRDYDSWIIDARN